MNASDHTCKTYLRLCVGDEAADIAAEDFLRENGIAYERFSPREGLPEFEIGKNTAYRVDVNDMLRATLSAVFGHEAELAALQRAYAVEAFLVVVPTVAVGSPDPTPILGPAPDIVDFLHDARVEFDLDYSFG